MKNKTLIALAVAASCLTTSANAIGIYSMDDTNVDLSGRVEFRGNFIGKSNGQEIEGTMQNKSRFRLKIKGKTQITDSLSGFGLYEGNHGINSSADNVPSSKFNQRYMFVGMKDKDLGAVSFGRQTTAAIQVSKMSDVTYFTGVQRTFINAADDQVNNTVLYTGNFTDLSIKASAILGEEKDTDGYGVSAIYDFPVGLAVGLGYATNGNGEGKGNGDSLIGGLTYTIDSLRIGGTYNFGDLDDIANEKFSGLELSAVYELNTNLLLQTAYINTEEEINGIKKDTRDYFELSANYRFNKSFNAYIAYMFNQMDESAEGANDAEDSMRLGLRYSF